MSSDQGSDPGRGAANAHDPHHEAFDPEPVQELPAGEAPSPGWLPVVGGSLLLVAATWFFYPGAGGATAPAAAPAAPTAVPTAAPAAAAPKPPASGALKLPDGKRRLSDLKAIQTGKAKPAASR